MSLDGDVDRGYELDREGEAFVKGNPRPTDLANPELDYDITSTGLSGDTDELNAILLTENASLAFDRDLADVTHAILDQANATDDPEHP